jgi:hypothetical protein
MYESSPGERQEPGFLATLILLPRMLLLLQLLVREHILTSTSSYEVPGINSRGSSPMLGSWNILRSLHLPIRRGEGLSFASKPPMACVLVRHQQHITSVFVSPAQRLAFFIHVSAIKRPRNVHHAMFYSINLPPLHP